MSSEWIAVEDKLPNLDEAVAIWLDDGSHQDLTVGRLAVERPKPLWRTKDGEMLGQQESSWQVTHWSRQALAADA